MAEVASAFVSLMPSAKGFGSKLESEVGGEVESSGKSLGSKFGKVFAIGAAVVGGAAVLGGFLKGSIDEAREAQKVGALTVATIKATGGAANVTADQVGNLAGALSRQTGIDDEVIQSGQNMLLTFKNIRNETGKGNDIFNQSTKALIDMSAAMGTEPKQAAIQLGKALNDPIKGVASLGRVGVQFTDQQKEQIKTLVESGRTMDAQKIVLGELNSQFGGAAAAQATAGDKAKVAWGNFQEAVGTALLPLLDRLLTGLTSVINFMGDRVGPAFSAVQGHIAPAVAAFRGLVSSFGGEGGGGLTSALGSVVAAFQSAFAVIAPIVQQIVGVIRQHWGAISGFVQQTFGTIVSIVGDALRLVAAVVSAQVAILKGLWNRFGDDLLRIATTIFEAVAGVIKGALNVIQGIIRTVTALIKGDWSGAWDGIKQIVKGAWQIITSLVKGALGLLKDVMRLGWDALKAVVSAAIGAIVDLVKAMPGKIAAGLSALGSKLWEVTTAGFGRMLEGARQIGGNVVDFARGLPGRIVGVFSGAGQMLWNVGVDIVQGLLGGLRSMAGEIVSTLVGLLPGPLQKFAGKLGIASPSKVFRDFGVNVGQGFVLGMRAMERPVADQMGALAMSPPRIASPRLAVATPYAATGGAGPLTMADVVAQLEALRRDVQALPRLHHEGLRRMSR